jgi:hypothetical protein
MLYFLESEITQIKREIERVHKPNFIKPSEYSSASYLSIKNIHVMLHVSAQTCHLWETHIWGKVLKVLNLKVPQNWHFSLPHS